MCLSLSNYYLCFIEFFNVFIQYRLNFQLKPELWIYQMQNKWFVKTASLLNHSYYVINGIAKVNNNIYLPVPSCLGTVMDRFTLNQLQETPPKHADLKKRQPNIYGIVSLPSYCVMSTGRRQFDWVRLGSEGHWFHQLINLNSWHVISILSTVIQIACYL